MLGLVHDSLGRPALAIGFAENNPRTEYELLFDPVSYALLDDRENVPTYGQGMMFSETAFIASGLVSRIGQVAPSRVLPRRR